MGFDLTNERIQDTYEQLVQISGSSLVDGTGSALPTIDNISVVSASYATTASFALNGGGGASTWDDITGKPAGLVSGSSQVSYTGISDVPSGILSSSAQIADDISGSFTSTSASIATEIASNTTNISTNTSNISTNTSNISTLTGETSSYAVKNSNNTFSGLQTFNNIAVNGTASIGYLQSVTGSAKIIGDAYIILNNDTPAQRYAGVKVFDSGSTNNSASFEFDGQTNDWFYEYTDDGGATEEFGVVMFGPGYNTRGSHVYPSNNTILKGTGDHHIEDSNITDNGTTIGMAGNVDLNSGGAIIISDYTGSLASTSVLIGQTNNDVTLVNPTGTKNVQIGSNVRIVESSQRNDVVAIGGDISAAQETISIGHTITNNTAAGIAIGNNVSLTSNNEINIGGVFKYDGSTTTTLTGNLQAAGASNLTSGNRRVALGNNNNVTADDATAIGGESNSVAASYCATLGAASANISSGDTSVIVGGYQHTINGGMRNAIVGGQGVTNGQDFTIVLGRESFTAPNSYTTYVANLDVSGSVVVSGSGITFSDGTTQTTAAGGSPGLVAGTGDDSMKSADDLTETVASAGGQYSIAIGDGAGASGFGALAIGQYTEATNTFSVALGYDAESSDVHSIAIGDSRAQAAQSIAIGRSSQTQGGSSVSIGYGSSNSSTADNAVAIGHNASNDTTETISIGFGAQASTLGAIVMGTDGRSIGYGDYGVNINGIFTYNSASNGEVSLKSNVETTGQIYSPTFAGTIASSTSSVDFDNGNFATLDCSAGATYIDNPTNLKSGTTYTLIITNGANISNYNTSWKFAGGTQPTLSAGTDILTCVSDGTNLYATALADFS